jgi:1,5-anhydro-D-fructose reductase (1,5-anhydro-D-mannitol-forming)
MIRAGIIGFGKMGKIRYEVISGKKNVETSLVYDPINKAKDLNNAQSPNDIIDNKDIDAIFICTPNYLNKELTIASLKAGKHVFCEKPPAFTAKDVEEIRRIEFSSGKLLMYGFNHRHHASIKKMKNLIDSKELGRVLWMRGRYGKSVDKSYYDNWRAKKKFAGGGILIDQGIHMLDLFLFLGGDFDSIHASVSNLYWNLNVEDNVFATLENSKTGLAASLHSTMTQWRHLFSLEVFLEKGYFVLNGLKTSSNTYGEEILTIAKNRSVAPAATWENEKNITYHSDKSWESEVDHFITAIKNNGKIKIGNSDDAIRLMRIIDKIYSFKKKV